MTSPRNVVLDKDKVFNSIIQEIEKMANSYVKIGIFADQKTKAQTKVNSNTGVQRSKKANLSMAEIANVNEYGRESPPRIPARSFVRSTYDENLQKLIRLQNKEYDKIIAGKTTVYASLNAQGLWMQNLIQTKITTLRTPPNAPSTIKAKGSSNPLIDFGQLRDSVTYEVVIA